jgi:hypothetical protein
MTSTPRARALLRRSCKRGALFAFCRRLNARTLLVALVAISEVEGAERLQALILVVGLRALVMLAGLLAA